MINHIENTSFIPSSEFVWDKDTIIKSGRKFLIEKIEKFNIFSEQLRIAKHSGAFKDLQENLYQKVKELAKENLNDVTLLHTKALEILNTDRDFILSNDVDTLAKITEIALLSMCYYKPIAETAFWPHLEGDKNNTRFSILTAAFTGAILSLPAMFLFRWPSLPLGTFVLSGLTISGCCLSQIWDQWSIEQSASDLQNKVFIHVKSPVKVMQWG